MRKWLYNLYYTFTTGRSHTKKLCSRLYSIEIEFYSKIVFGANLWGLRGIVRNPSIARWKVRGRLRICQNWIVFTISYCWDVISENLSKSAFFEGVGHFERKFQTEGGIAYQPLSMSENIEWLPFRVVSKYPQYIVWFCHKAHVWQTDRRTELRLPRPR